MALTVPRCAVTLAELREHRDQIHAIAARYGIRNIRVFGSLSRDTATADLDLLVDLDPGHGYLDLTGFALDVEDLLHSPSSSTSGCGAATSSRSPPPAGPTRARSCWLAGG